MGIYLKEHMVEPKMSARTLFFFFSFSSHLHLPVFHGREVIASKYVYKPVKNARFLFFKSILPLVFTQLRGQMGVLLISKRELKIVALGWRRRENNVYVAILETALFDILLCYRYVLNI